MNNNIIQMTTPSLTRDELSISKLPVFKSELTNNNEFRVLGTYNEPWFIGKDIAKYLGYKDMKQAIRDHVNEKDKISYKQYIETKGVFNTTLKLHPDTVLINESGLYSLMFGSKKPEAKLFREWVTGDVLPSIRKTGEYINLELKNQIKNLENKFCLELKEKDMLYYKLDKKYNSLLKHKAREKFDIGSVFYLVYHEAFILAYKKIYIKFGIAKQKENENISAFTSRLSGYNTSSPIDYKPLYLMYLPGNRNKEVEDITKKRFESEIEPVNKEWIKGVSIDKIIKFVQDQCKLLTWEYKEQIFNENIENLNSLLLQINDYVEEIESVDENIESESEYENIESDNENIESDQENIESDEENIESDEETDKENIDEEIELQSDEQNAIEEEIFGKHKSKRINFFKKVEQWSYDGSVLLKIYNNALEAATDLKKSPSSIRNCLNKQQPTAHKFCWKYSTETNDLRKKVEKRDLEKKLLKRYNSVSEAQIKNNIKHVDHIYYACNNNSKSGGFYWNYV
jgi:prophage antirepressor-like protein